MQRDEFVGIVQSVHCAVWGIGIHTIRDEAAMHHAQAEFAQSRLCQKIGIVVHVVVQYNAAADAIPALESASAQSKVQFVAAVCKLAIDIVQLDVPVKTLVISVDLLICLGHIQIAMIGTIVPICAHKHFFTGHRVQSPAFIPEIVVSILWKISFISGIDIEISFEQRMSVTK